MSGMAQALEPVTPARVYYFGCGNRPGHWWHSPAKLDSGNPMQRDWGVESAMRTVFTKHVDGNFCPDGDIPGEAKLTRTRGWTVLAWWDRSVDTRHGSNSVLAVDADRDFDQMVALLQVLFPEVYKRQLVPIKFVQMEIGS